MNKPYANEFIDRDMRNLIVAIMYLGTVDLAVLGLLGWMAYVWLSIYSI